MKEINLMSFTMPRFRCTSFSLLSVTPLLLAIFLLTGCDDDSSGPTPPDYSTVPAPYDTANAEKVVKDNGVTYYLIKKGSGPFEVVARDRVEVYITGRDASGDVFTSSYKNGSTDPKVVSLPGSIEGLKSGLIGMKIGGKRKIIVPPELGFQSEQHKLHGDTLVYDVKLADIL